jgi:hypothetical protein
VGAKNEARKALEAGVRQLVGEYLTKNHLMTDNYRRELGLPIPDRHPTHSPVATEAPELEIEFSTEARITFIGFKRGNKNRRGKPEGQGAGSSASPSSPRRRNITMR